MRCGTTDPFDGENRVLTTVASPKNAGRPVSPMSLRGDPYGAVLEAVLCLEAPDVAFGLSECDLDWQCDRDAQCWTRLGRRCGAFHAEVIPDGGEPVRLNFGDGGTRC